MLPVAALDDFKAGPIQSQRAFGHQQYTGLLRFFIHAAARSEVWAAGWPGNH
jgi:hypothetical protein